MPILTNTSTSLTKDCRLSSTNINGSHINCQQRVAEKNHVDLTIFNDDKNEVPIEGCGLRSLPLLMEIMMNYQQQVAD
jgi:predicted small secreted protein